VRSGIVRTTRRSRTGLVVAGLTGVLVAAGVVSASSASAAAGCQVAYELAGQWQGGFQGNVTINNLGERVDGWSLSWAFPDGQQVAQSWNAVVTTSGATTTAKNAGYNPTIPAGGTVSFGFLGTWNGSNGKPASFTLNGVTCTGETAPTSTPPTSTPPTSTPPTPPPGNAMATVAAMEPGWNVGNTLDAIPDETSWGNPPITKELFDAVKAEGYHSVRIPVTWSNRQSASAPYAIDAAYLSRVKQVVDWAVADNLYVLLNVHHDSWQWISKMESDHDNVLNRFNATWTQIATTVKDEPNTVLLESVNEPQFDNATDDQKAQLLNELNTSFHTIVRQSGGNNATRVLVLPTLGCTPDQNLMDALNSELNSLNDPNLAVSVHYYGFWPFSVNIANFTTFNAQVQQDMTDAFTRMPGTFTSKGIPVILGEDGLMLYDFNHPGAIERGELWKYFEALGYQARANKVTTMLWDTSSFLNRSTNQWRDPDFMAWIKSSWTTRSGTASSDVVFLPKSGAIAGQTLTLNPNGLIFQDLRQGSTKLVQGSDYTISGDQLTLSSALLTRLAGNRAYGMNATLRAQFSQGVAWPIDVRTYSTPVLSNATGPTDSFAIPAQFNGDMPATMESHYADGSNAGTASWTPYQAFRDTWYPDTTANVINLTSDYFNALNDGAPVTLTFHYWSGASVTYHLTKSGTNVTGTVN
jgi:endoglucanase